MMTKRITVMVGLVALAGLLAACGSDGDSDSSGDGVASVSDDDSNEQAQGDDQADTQEELLDWVECMRDEGIDIPDPTRDENGNLVIDGPGIRLGSGDSAGSSSDENDDDGDERPVDPDEMDAAMEACGGLPALGPNDLSEEDRQAMEEDALEFAECMRDEGIEDFPDPDFSDMGPGGEPQRRSSGDDGGEGDDDGGPQVFLGPFGEIDMDDPDVRAAFEACQDLLGGPDLPNEPDQSSSDQSTAA
jgi:hypothetical protein